MKIAVAGRHDRRLTPVELSMLGHIASYATEIVVLDTMDGLVKSCQKWAAERDVPVKLISVDWSCGKTSTLVANHYMIEYSDGVVLFEGGDEVRHVRELAINSKIPVVDFRPALDWFTQSRNTGVATWHSKKPVAWVTEANTVRLHYVRAGFGYTLPVTLERKRADANIARLLRLAGRWGNCVDERLPVLVALRSTGEFYELDPAHCIRFVHRNVSHDGYFVADCDKVRPGSLARHLQVTK